MLPESAVVCANPAPVVVPEPGETCTDHDLVVENVPPAVAVVYIASALFDRACSALTSGPPLFESAAPAAKNLADPASVSELLTKLKTKEARELVMDAVEKQKHGRLVCSPFRSKKASKYPIAFSIAGAQKDNVAAVRTATTSCILMFGSSRGHQRKPGAVYKYWAT